MTTAVGLMLKGARSRISETQAGMARKLRVSRNAIIDYESGRYLPGAQKASQIIEEYKLNEKEQEALLRALIPHEVIVLVKSYARLLL